MAFDEYAFVARAAAARSGAMACAERVRAEIRARRVAADPPGRRDLPPRPAEAPAEAPDDWPPSSWLR